VLPSCDKLVTSREAIAHLGKAIPKSDYDMPAVLIAAEMLTNAAEHGGPVEFARIATPQAQPSRCPRVQSRAKSPALGSAQAETRHRRMRGELPRNAGTDGDGVAQIEADHFQKCPVCSQWFDMRNLAQVAGRSHDAPGLKGAAHIVFGILPGFHLLEEVVEAAATDKT
jgi:hypothetical protein